jgi:hypothetical protein
MTRSPLTALRPASVSRAALPALLVSGALLLSACGTQTGPGGSGGSPSPTTPAAITSLDAAKAAWTAYAGRTGEYRLMIVPSCFCRRIGLDVTVKDGKPVAQTPVDVDNTGGAATDPVLDGFPRTVEDLHRVIADAKDAASISVTYDSRGVPLRIYIDAIANAADDEMGYTVSFSSATDGGTAPADDGSWKQSSLPSGAVWPADMPIPGQGSGQAAVVRRGTGASLVLGLWGSSSCPQVPKTLRLEPATEPSGPQSSVIRAVVEVDDTQPADTACTADLGPTVYAAELPADVAAALTAPDPAADSAVAVVGSVTVLQVVVETVTGAPGATGSTSYALDAYAL